MIETKLLTDEDVDYWVDTINDDIGFQNSEYTRSGCKALVGKIKQFSIDNTGVFVYMTHPDLDGATSFIEIVFYIYPQFRGNLRLVKNYINEAERIAQNSSCNKIKVGGNIGYKDSSFLHLLKRWGYETDTVFKEL